MRNGTLRGSALAAVLCLAPGVALAGDGAAPRAARALVDEAMAAARAQDKIVLVVFGASWCGPCRQLDRFLGAPDVAPIVAAHFVPVHLVAYEKDSSLENPGAEELKEELGGGKGGIPYYCFLNGDGRRLADSRSPVNIGFPVTRHEIAAFDTLLQRVAPRMTAGERWRIKKRLLILAARHITWDSWDSPFWRALGPIGRALFLIAVCLVGWLILSQRRRRGRA